VILNLIWLSTSEDISHEFTPIHTISLRESSHLWKEKFKVEYTFLAGTICSSVSLSWEI